MAKAQDAVKIQTILRRYRSHGETFNAVKALDMLEEIAQAFPEPGYQASIEVDDKGVPCLIVADLMDNWRVGLNSLGDEETPTLEAMYAYAVALQSTPDECRRIVESSREASKGD